MGGGGALTRPGRERWGGPRRGPGAAGSRTPASSHTARDPSLPSLASRSPGAKVPPWPRRPPGPPAWPWLVPRSAHCCTGPFTSPDWPCAKLPTSGPLHRLFLPSVPPPWKRAVILRPNSLSSSGLGGLAPHVTAPAKPPFASLLPQIRLLKALLGPLALPSRHLWSNLLLGFYLCAA